MKPETINRCVLALALVAALPAVAAAQQPTRRREAPIVIRGQVPTPQVVTVRPRAVPAYSRQVLVPRFYDHDFWPEIDPSYQLVPARMLRGDMASDSLGVHADSARAASVGSVGLPKFFPDSTKPAKPNAGTAPARRP